MKKVIKKNQVVITALAALIAVAGYLNFQESKVASGTQNALSLQEEGDDVALLDDYATLPDDMEEAVFDPITAEVAETTGDGAALYVNSAQTETVDASQYFAEAKLDREQSRAKQEEMLNEMLHNASLSAEQKDRCSESLLTIQDRIEKESAAEAMIEAKGFGQAYVRIDDETVDVVVDASELTDQQVAQIEDIVTRKTGYNKDQLRISTLKTK